MSSEQPPDRRAKPRHANPRAFSDEAIRSRGPWIPQAWQLADATAVQALLGGTGDAEQQQRVLRFIIENLCGTYDVSYRPGEDGRRDTDFAEGKRWVGLQLIKLSRLSVGELRRLEDAQKQEPGRKA